MTKINKWGVVLKVHLRIFVEVENLGKYESLVEAGIAGFILEYKDMSHQDWEGFSIKDPKSTLRLIRSLLLRAHILCG